MPIISQPVGAGAAPTGAAGGDLSGTYPNPAVAKVNGIAVTVTPAVGYVPTATSTSAATWQALPTIASQTASNPPAGPVDFNGQKLTGLANAASHSDAAAFGQVTALTLNSQSGTTYTFVAADEGKLVEGTNGSATAYTIPTNASVAFPVGSLIYISQQGAGQITVAGAGGVTLRSPNGAKTHLQYSQVCLTKRAADEWIISGDTSS